MPALASRREPVPMERRERSLLGSETWSLANAWIRPMGSAVWVVNFSMAGPPGMISTS